MTDFQMDTIALLGEDHAELAYSGLLDPVERSIAELDAMAQAYDKYIFKGKRKIPGSGWLSDRFIRQVHADMFQQVWRWGGKYRIENWAVGVEPQLIESEISLLCRDFFTWDHTDSSLLTLEIGARLQNRLTRIHAFKHGNGRHACLMTDIFLRSRKHPIPKWPQFHETEQGNTLREQYIAAMIHADEESYEDLIRFISQRLE